MSVSTPKIVIAVAACVRLTMLEQNSPNAPEPERRHDQDEVAAHEVVRRDAAEHEHDSGQRDRGRDEQPDIDECAERACR